VVTEPKRSQECERGTQECVRYGRQLRPRFGNNTVDSAAATNDLN
jgi:hypothetical protein